MPVDMSRIPRVAVVLLVLVLAGCYTVPETGRSAFIIPMGDEVAEGAAAFSDIKSKEKLSTDPVYNEQVQRVGKRIAEAVGNDLPSAKWEFVVFDEPKTVNAFALPGGKVGVYSGLIKLVASDDEIAIVMGHEIAHVTSRHGAERTSQTEAVQGLGMLGSALMDFEKIDPAKQNLILGAYGLASNVGVLLPFSRTHESEADAIGLRFAAQAGYDPRAAVTFWQRMSAANANQSKPPAWLSTHPADATRIANLQRMIPEYMPVYEAAKQRYQ